MTASTKTPLQVLADLRAAIRTVRAVNEVALTASPMVAGVELDDEQAAEALRLMADLTGLGLGVLIDAGFAGDDCLEDAAEFVETVPGILAGLA